MVDVNYPDSPHGSPQMPFAVTVTDTPSDSTGIAHIVNDVLLFEVTNDDNNNDDKEFQIKLLFPDTLNSLIQGSSLSILWLDADRGTRYIEFIHFPTESSGDTIKQCQYAYSLLKKNGSSNNHVSMAVTIYEGY